MTKEFHYCGEAIIPAGSILRQLPDALDAAQKMRFDALTYSGDALQHSWIVMRDTAASAGPDVGQISDLERVGLLLSAWSIVDQLNAVRQIFQSLKKTVPSNLQAALETARKMRNGMDHLDQKIPNLSKKKGTGSALFGSLSYCLPRGVPVTSATLVVVASGAVHGTQEWPVTNPAGKVVRGPADLFQLTAFDATLELGPPLAILRDWIPGLCAELNTQLIAWAASTSEKQGVDPKKLLQSRGGGCVVAAMTWIPDPSS
ncbi:MAG TPA: hypothetical protein VFK19_12650 [Sphingomicrobium sp.]|nr:hypothetical protein [Sphingomicrobium sp.]